MFYHYSSLALFYQESITSQTFFSKTCYQSQIIQRHENQITRWLTVSSPFCLMITLHTASMSRSKPGCFTGIIRNVQLLFVFFTVEAQLANDTKKSNEYTIYIVPPISLFYLIYWGYVKPANELYKRFWALKKNPAFAIFVINRVTCRSDLLPLLSSLCWDNATICCTWTTSNLFLILQSSTQW